MRNRFTGAAVGLAAVLVFSSFATAQTAQSQPKQGNEARSPWKYYPMDRAVGDGGPAPKRDLTGTWAGPGSGAAVPKGTNAQAPTAPPLTPLGKQLYDQNKPIGKYSPAGTNDPHTRYCDPFGFPQNMTNEIRGMTITTLPNRTFILIQYMDLWREIWTDEHCRPMLPRVKTVSIRGITGTRWAIGRTTIHFTWTRPGWTIAPGRPRTGILIASMLVCRNAITGMPRMT